MDLRQEKTARARRRLSIGRGDGEGRERIDGAGQVVLIPSSLRVQASDGRNGIGLGSSAEKEEGASEKRTHLP